MKSFVMNGILWRVKFVESTSEKLIDRIGTITLATTDPVTTTIYISNELYGDLLNRVVIHELGHCALFSFNLLDVIHSMIQPEYWIEVEEWICNFLADYGFRIFSAAYSILDEEALFYVSEQYDKLIA